MNAVAVPNYKPTIYECVTLSSIESRTYVPLSPFRVHELTSTVALNLADAKLEVLREHIQAIAFEVAESEDEQSPSPVIVCNALAFLESAKTFINLLNEDRISASFYGSIIFDFTILDGSKVSVEVNEKTIGAFVSSNGTVGKPINSYFEGDKIPDPLLHELQAIQKRSIGWDQ